MRILLASQNAKKLAELRLMLEPLGHELLAPADVGGLPEVVEDLPTFRGNAAKKAKSAALASGEWSLADDSGLEVDALQGAPGVHSARFAGEHGDDAANNALLLERLSGLPAERRSARFVCALALVDSGGKLRLELEGHARGRILESPRGTRDFGYDPLFLFDEPGSPHTGRGFAELNPTEKSEVSHRGRALVELRRRLPELMPA